MRYWHRLSPECWGIEVATKDKQGKVEISGAAIERLEKALKAEVQEFKDLFKNEFIQLSDRVDELAEVVGGGHKDEHKLLLTQKLYKTDVREILEVSRIPRSAAEPLAYALALDEKTGRGWRRNGVSLTAIVIDNILRLNLSGGGWNRGLSMPAIVEQAAVITEEEEPGMPTVEAGSRR